MKGPTAEDILMVRKKHDVDLKFNGGSILYRKNKNSIHYFVL